MTSGAFTNDELILMLISLVRATHPAMLRSEGDGFAVDFEGIDHKKSIDEDDRLLLKMRAVLESPSESALGINLSASESQRLAGTLEVLETLQPWPADVLAMSRDLRRRLARPRE